jgi:hypothetical protein
MDHLYFFLILSNLQLYYLLDYGNEHTRIFKLGLIDSRKRTMPFFLYIKNLKKLVNTP